MELKGKDSKIAFNLLMTEEKTGKGQVLNCNDYSSIDRLF